MSVTISPPMFLQFFDPNNSGAPLAGGKLFTYQAGTSIKQATWTDSTQSVQNNNPIILDANGAGYVWLDPTLTYKFVLSPANDSDPPTSPLRSVDNINPNMTAATITRAFLGSILYPKTAAEIALSVTPTDFSYPADPYVDPRRYGADPTGVAISTTAVQTALNVAYQAKGCLWIGNNCNYLVGALSLTMTGNQTNDGLRIMGSAPNGSKLTQSGTPGAILSLTGQTPTTNPQVSPVVLENFAIVCSGRVTDGIVLTSVAEWDIYNVYISGANRGIFLNSALIGQIRKCTIFSNHYGIQARQNGGSASGTNLITLQNNRFYGNDYWGVDWGSGDRLKYLVNDTSQNGTAYAITFTGAPTGSSATLTAAWAQPTGQWPVYFSDGEVRAVTLTNGATTATWGAALTGAPTTAATAYGGALVIRNTVNVNTGFANIDLDGGWFEANLGQTMFVENTSLLTLSIRNYNWYNDTGGRSLFVDGLNLLTIEDSFAPGAAQTFLLPIAIQLFLKNVTVTTLTDSSTYPTYVNVTGNGLTQTNGRRDNFTATLTGCTTAPTVNVAIYQQGAEIMLEFLGQITATSSSTAATLTGLPSKYWPQADTIGQLEVQDNSANLTRPVQVAAATGIITLGFGQTLTAAGSKGVVGGTLRFRRP